MLDDINALASFALGELGLRLDEFYDMQLNELLIKSEAYNRKRGQEILDIQFLAYHSLIGSHYDSKKLPSFEKFIGKNANDVKKLNASEEAKELLIKEVVEYYRTVRGDR